MLLKNKRSATWPLQLRQLDWLMGWLMGWLKNKRSATCHLRLQQPDWQETTSDEEIGKYLDHLETCEYHRKLEVLHGKQLQRVQQIARTPEEEWSPPQPSGWWPIPVTWRTNIVQLPWVKALQTMWHKLVKRGGDSGYSVLTLQFAGVMLVATVVGLSFWVHTTCVEKSVSLPGSDVGSPNIQASSNTVGEAPNQHIGVPAPAKSEEVTLYSCPVASKHPPKRQVSGRNAKHKSSELVEEGSKNQELAQAGELPRLTQEKENILPGAAVTEESNRNQTIAQAAKLLRAMRGKEPTKVESVLTMLATECQGISWKTTQVLGDGQEYNVRVMGENLDSSTPTINVREVKVKMMAITFSHPKETGPEIKGCLTFRVNESELTKFLGIMQRSRVATDLTRSILLPESKPKLATLEGKRPNSAELGNGQPN